MKTTDAPVVVEQTFEAAPKSVWQAITDVDQMRQWLFDNIPSFEPRVGFETKFIVTSGNRDFPHIWKVTEVVPLRRIAFDWKYEGYPGDSFVVFELLEEGNSTRLRLTATVRADFPDDIPEFTRESCLAGWEYFIKNRLKEYLQSRR